MMKRYNSEATYGYMEENPNGVYIEYTYLEKILQHLNQDKDGDYFLTKESFKEIFEDDILA